MSSPTILLPGDTISAPTASLSASNPLKLGPNLHILSSSQTDLTESPTIVTTQSGVLALDTKRNALSLLSFPQRRYIPTQGDLVIAQVQRSSADYYHCSLSPHYPSALLGHLSFEGATRKTRPQLKVTELVYARVLSVGIGPGAEVELTCVNPVTGKAEPGGLGPLNGGMVFDISVGFAARLMMGSSQGGGGIVVLEELGRKLESQGGFEIAVGRNGRVWVDCSGNGGNDAGIRATVAIGRCLQETDDRRLEPAEQKKLVSRVLREMALGN
ncbi:hypothetical protein VTO42DRAFT_970 [Malbranchea cinnamomea]